MAVENVRATGANTRQHHHHSNLRMTRPTTNRWVKQAPESSIYVFGAVNAPGRYMMAHNMTYWTCSLPLTALAVGLTSNALW